jgi:hypothetical protein
MQWHGRIRPSKRHWQDRNCTAAQVRTFVSPTSEAAASALQPAVDEKPARGLRPPTCLIFTKCDPAHARQRPGLLGRSEIGHLTVIDDIVSTRWSLRNDQRPLSEGRGRLASRIRIDVSKRRGTRRRPYVTPAPIILCHEFCWQYRRVSAASVAEAELHLEMVTRRAMRRRGNVLPFC